MAMKETEGSLRGYFLIAGACSLLIALSDLGHTKQLKGLVLTVPQTLAIYVPIVTHFILGVGFLIAGIKLKSALLTGAEWIKKLLVASGAMMFINGALLTWAFHLDRGYEGLIVPAIALAITIYLHRSVTRLAAEAASRAGIAPPPPAAKVV